MKSSVDDLSYLRRGILIIIRESGGKLTEEEEKETKGLNVGDVE